MDTNPNLLMDFDKFREYIPKILTQILPGETSHLKMIPPERMQIFKEGNIDESNARKACVMMLFYPKNDEPHLVLILRNSYKGVHSSQIGFPGGKVEVTDISLEDTALRETFEEVGIHRDLIEVIKPFTPIYIPPSNFKVYPFLGYATQELVFIPNDREVFGIIELPLSVLMDANNLVNKTLSTSYMNEISVPAFKFQDHYIWGATSQMLNELKDVLTKVI